MLDPVHGWIEIDDLCLKIIDTPLFQRLGYVKQLTSAEYVFPGARHTRKEHSIGAMWVVSKYISSLEKKETKENGKENLTDEEKASLKIAALLHDVAHGFYSHSFDATIYFDMYGEDKGHDIHRHNLLKYFTNVIPKEYLEKVSNIWNDKIKYLSAIIQGPLSVDRFDFTKRDSFYTGVKYGIFDIERIIDNCSIETLVNGTKFLVYNSKIVKSALQGLNTRLYMYEEIYLSKNVIAASVLIDLMILEASKHINYVERVQDIEKFIYLNDASAFSEILNSTSPQLSVARKYAQLLYHRKLPRMISEKKIIIENVKEGKGEEGKRKGKEEEGEKREEKEKEGVTLLPRNLVKWVSRSLNRNFTEEFEKYNIHIKKGDELYTFRDYCAREKIEISNENYYFERIYEL